MVAECFWKLKESIKLQIQEAQWPLIRKRKGSPKYIVVKMLKVKDKKEKTLRASREKWLTIYRELLWNYKLTSEINGGQTTLERLIQSAERITTRKSQPRFQYSAKLCLKNETSKWTEIELIATLKGDLHHQQTRNWELSAYRKILQRNWMRSSRQISVDGGVKIVFDRLPSEAYVSKSKWCVSTSNQYS